MTKDEQIKQAQAETETLRKELQAANEKVRALEDAVGIRWSGFRPSVTFTDDKHYAMTPPVKGGIQFWQINDMHKMFAVLSVSVSLPFADEIVREVFTRIRILSGEYVVDALSLLPVKYHSAWVSQLPPEIEREMLRDLVIALRKNHDLGIENVNITRKYEDMKSDYLGAMQSVENLQRRFNEQEGFHSWERVNSNRKDIIGKRELSDGRVQYLCRNDALSRPYYLSNGQLDPAAVVERTSGSEGKLTEREKEVAKLAYMNRVDEHAWQMLYAAAEAVLAERTAGSEPPRTITNLSPHAVKIGCDLSGGLTITAADVAQAPVGGEPQQETEHRWASDGAWIYAHSTQPVEAQPEGDVVSAAKEAWLIWGDYPASIERFNAIIAPIVKAVVSHKDAELAKALAEQEKRLRQEVRRQIDAFQDMFPRPKGETSNELVCQIRDTVDNLFVHTPPAPDPAQRVRIQDIDGRTFRVFRDGAIYYDFSLRAHAETFRRGLIAELEGARAEKESK